MRRQMEPKPEDGPLAYAQPMWRGLALVGMAWVCGAIALRLVVVPAERCPGLGADDAAAGALESASWIARVQEADGSYLYEFDIEDNEVVPGYNEVRHAGVTMSLYQLAAEGYPNGLVTANRGLAWMEANLLAHDDWVALQGPGGGRISVGASALMLAGLAQRRLATRDSQHDMLMHRLARFLLVMQQPDGSFLESWSPGTGAPEPGLRSKYATGEAFWALALMHRLFPAEGWERPARAVADYLSLNRDRVEHQKFPPWADQWAAYGLNELAPSGLSDANIEYARSLSARFGFLVRVESQRTTSTFSKLVHGRRARAAGLGTWVEALGSLWLLARADSRLADLEPDLRERLVCSAGMLRDRQVTAAAARRYANPAVAEGAWFTERKTRMDDQQHALSGLIRARGAIAGAAR